MKKAKLFLGLLILVFWSCGTSSSSSELDNESEETTNEVKSEANEPKKTIEGWETYTKDGFSIQYPKEWELKTQGQTGSEFGLFAPVESDEDKFRENINLFKEDISAHNIDLDAYADLSKNQVLQMFTDAKILESGKKNGNGKSFYKMVYTTVQGIFNLKFVQYYSIENKTAYVLTFTAEADKFDKFWNDGEKIMESFSLK